MLVLALAGFALVFFFLLGVFARLVKSDLRLPEGRRRLEGGGGRALAVRSDVADAESSRELVEAAARLDAVRLTAALDEGFSIGSFETVIAGGFKVWSLQEHAANRKAALLAK